MKALTSILLILIFSVAKLSYAQSVDKHDDAQEHDEHAHEEKPENSNVGPKRGIAAASEHDGIRLTPEAVNSFEIKTIQVVNPDQLTIPKTAVVKSAEERNVFRVRKGFYKRIDFETLKKTDVDLIVSSKELLAGDEIVIQGMGYLRIAELTAFGGADEGHHH